MVQQSWLSLAIFAPGEAHEQHGSVKRAVRNAPTGLPVKAVYQLAIDLPRAAGGLNAARQ